jgi:TolA-binding protein
MEGRDVNEETPPQEALETTPPTELDRLRELVRQNLKPALIAAALVFLAVSAASYLKHRSRAKAEEAAERLSASRTTKDLDDLAAENPSSPIAPLAMMKAAKEYFDAGEFNAAQQRYAAFQKQHAGHPLASAAALGEIECQEARGQVGDAMLAYIAFGSKHPGHYLLPQAILGQARCLEQMQRYGEALDLCASLIKDHADSGWKSLAAEMKLLLERKIERQKHPPPARPAPTNAPPPLPTPVMGQP